MCEPLSQASTFLTAEHRLRSAVFWYRVAAATYVHSLLEVFRVADVGKRDGGIRQGACVYENVLHIVERVRCGFHFS